MNHADTHARLGAELEAQVVRALLRDWESINYNHFRRGLRPPVLFLTDNASRLGEWTRADRSIGIARRLVLEQPWGIVVEVLKHEMAHQYADEVLGARGETAHGAAFRRGCEILGIDPAASGLPTVEGPVPDEEARVLQRIAKLLALAESPNQNEAELAMREAQRLMLKYNVEARATGQKSDYGFRHLGEPTGRLQAHQRRLAAILGSHFFVEAIWVSVHRPLAGKHGTVLEICGTPANLEMAAHVHDFLLQTAERLWREHQRQTGTRSNRLRRSYLEGVMGGFQTKLDEQGRKDRREGLILLKDAGLSDYFDRRYPRRENVRSSGYAHPEAYAAGKEAGRSIVLHRPMAQATSGGVRMLPPRR